MKQPLHPFTSTNKICVNSRIHKCIIKVVEHLINEGFTFQHRSGNVSGVRHFIDSVVFTKRMKDSVNCSFHKKRFTFTRSCQRATERIMIQTNRVIGVH